MTKSLVPLAITSIGFLCVGVVFNNCSQYQDSTLPSNNAANCADYNNANCSNTEPFLNPPTNNLATTISEGSKTQLQINGSCFLGPDPKPHRIEFYLYKNEDSQKTKRGSVVNPKCEKGRYFAILNIGAELDSGSYGLRGNLYLDNSTNPTSSTDKTFCYGTGCQ